MRINKHFKNIFIKISHCEIIEYTENNNFPIAVALAGCGTGEDMGPDTGWGCESPGAYKDQRCRA